MAKKRAAVQSVNETPTQGDLPKKKILQATDRQLSGKAYISSGHLYRVSEVKARLGLSKRWLLKARAKGLTFIRVSERGNEVVDGEQLRRFILEHPNLLQEEL